MKRAFLVWTPFHLLNIIRFVLTNDLIGCCDVYFISQSDAMDMFLDNTIEEKLFDNIFYTTIDDVERNKRINEIKSILLPSQKYVSYMFGEKAVNRDYDELYVSIPTRLNDAIYRANNCKEVIGYDDGLASYVTNLYNYSLGSKYELYKKLLGKGRLSVDKVLLCNPNMNLHPADGINYMTFIGRDLTPDENRIINRVFNYTESEIKQHIIYLNQPLRDMPDPDSHKQGEKQILQIINEQAGDELIIRIHPRETETEIYQGLTTENSENMWELMCNDCITEGHSLVSFFSTALFAPKLFFNKEPYLIFTFMLFQSCPDSQKNRYLQLVEKLQSEYSKKDRITVPRTVEELTDAIRTRINQ